MQWNFPSGGDEHEHGPATLAAPSRRPSAVADAISNFLRGSNARTAAGVQLYLVTALGFVIIERPSLFWPRLNAVLRCREPIGPASVGIGFGLGQLGFLKLSLSQVRGEQTRLA